jgi:hypothetical protein
MCQPKKWIINLDIRDGRIHSQRTPTCMEVEVQNILLFSRHKTNMKFFEDVRVGLRDQPELDVGRRIQAQQQCWPTAVALACVLASCCKTCVRGCHFTIQGKAA